MDRERKLQALQKACRNREGIFYRTFVVGSDGKLDIVENNDQVYPWWQLEGLRPGLWRSTVRYTEALETVGLWAVWVCDGESSRDLLEKMTGRQEVDEDMKEQVRMRSQRAYTKSLKWEELGYGPEGDYYILVRSRHVLSSELYTFLHDSDTIEDAESAQNWRRTLHEWYHSEHPYGHSTLPDAAEESGVLIGGAYVSASGLDGCFSFAKDDGGQTIGILIGYLNEFGEESDQDSLENFDLVEHEEALAEENPRKLHAITLECIHCGDPHLETETPNYFPRMEMMLQVDDLLKDVAAVVTDRIVEQLRVWVNPYVDLSHVLDSKCDCQGVYESKIHLVRFKVEPSFWANLRKEDAPTNASVLYHIPLMHHAVSRSTLDKPDRGQTPGVFEQSTITEWTPPLDSSEWISSSRPTLCPPEEYRLEPVFRYVGCGYAITPDSSYPPLKARHIWRWFAAIYEFATHHEACVDPYKAIYEIGKESNDISEMLGQTVLGIDENDEHHFLDVYGIDLNRGLLFGWLRLEENGRERFSALVLSSKGRGSELDSNSDESSFPPFRKIKIHRFGFPRLIPLPPPEERPLSVFIRCRQMMNQESPYLIPDFQLEVPSMHEEFCQFLSTICKFIYAHLIEHHLLHPLYVQALRDYSKGEDNNVVQINIDTNFWIALRAYVSRGERPPDTFPPVRWAIGGMLDFDFWDAYKPLGIPPSVRQQPAEGAWKAPEHWFEPLMPTVDPSGQYQAVDVMSFVGCGHILPPWSDYPPDKARFIWSRIIEEKNPIRNGLRGMWYALWSSQYRVDETKSPVNLLDYLGQTVMLLQGGQRFVADVFGVDRARSLVFGFSRMHEKDPFKHYKDTFICFQIDSSLTLPYNGPISSSPNPKLQPKLCNSIGLPVLKKTS